MLTRLSAFLVLYIDVQITLNAATDAIRVSADVSGRWRKEVSTRLPGASVPILFPERGSAAMAEPAEPTDAEVDAVIEEFEGDLREAIRALLHDVAVLAADYSSAVSRGYVRGRGARGADGPVRTGDRPVRAVKCP